MPPHSCIWCTIVPVHVSLCCADLHVPFGNDFHVVNIVEMRFCVTALLATLALGCIHLKLDRVGCMQQYIKCFGSCVRSLSFYVKSTQCARLSQTPDPWGLK